MTPPEQALTEDVARQAALLLRNVRLIEELRASRERIVAAQDDERRRLERDIHDGAQQQLVTLSLATRLAQSGLGPDAPAALNDLLERAVAESKQALAELRELARGIHPRILTERGLPAAIRSLAERAPVPVSVDAPEGERLPEAVEATAYFAVSEALQNIAKYAQASHAEVRTFRGRRRRCVVRVTDDGVGGADPSKGSGLRGLLDRIDAVGGRLDVHSPPARARASRSRCPSANARRRSRVASGSCGSRSPRTRSCCARAWPGCSRTRGSRSPGRRATPRSCSLASPPTRPTWRSSTSGCRRRSRTRGCAPRARWRRPHRDVGVLILSQYVETDFAYEILSGAAPGRGYLLKDRVMDLEAFADAVRRVGEGGSVVDPEVVDALLKRRRPASPLDALTEREREVLALMAEGRSNQAIGDAVHLSPKTIETHVHAIFTKLGLEPTPDDHRRVLAVVTYLRES